MTSYKNLNGNSSVEEYEIDIDYIKVKFTDSSIYKYSYKTPGKAHVEEMKRLAEQGYGLNSYIMTNPDVKNGYEAKLA